MTDHQKPEPAALTPLLLQAYHDRELNEQEQASIAVHLQHSAQERARLAALAEMGDLLRFESEQRVEQVDFSALWTAVHERICQQEPATPARTRKGFVSALRDFFVAHRVVLVPALAISAILAMLLVPMVLRQNGSEIVVEKERTIVVVEPLRLEGQANGTVSYTPGSNTPVIWYLGESPTEAAPPVRKRPLFIPIDSILERLERLEKLTFPPKVPDSSEQRRYNLDSLRQTDWYQRHQNDGPI